MLARLRPSGKSIAVSVLAGLALLLGTSSTLSASAPQSTRATAASHGTPIVLRSGTSNAPIQTGEVSLATLPTAKAGDIAATPNTNAPFDRPLKTPAQQAAYDQWVKTHLAALPHAIGQQIPTRSPNFVGGGTIPELVNQADGLNSTNAGCNNTCSRPDQAIAAAPGYVFEGVNNALEVYTPTYAQKYGPWTADTFFAPIKHTGASFSDPQITFDAERAVYLISWLEIVGSHDYLDLAISKTSTPSPLGNYFEYSIPATTSGSDDFCAYDTLGYDYWGVYVTCVTFSLTTSKFTGNRVFAFSTNNLLTGHIGTFAWFYNAPTSLSCGSGCLSPAYRLSPAIEDGVPNAEWVIASDSGYGRVSSNLTLCAITNTHALGSGTSPTFTCDLNTLPDTYADPGLATEPGGGLIDPGLGMKQIMYRGGRLYFAQGSETNCGGFLQDGILWADVVPQLTTNAAHNPQWVNGLVSAYTEANYWCYTNADSLMPTLYPDTEDDMSLVFNVVSFTMFPSIAYTGRMAADAPGTMGQGGASHVVVTGTTASKSEGWGDYSACALTTNLVTRGILFCGGQYGGANAWNTRIYQLRME
jgi:hypothetical protein